MNKPITLAVGRVWSQATIVTPENGGKSFVDFTLKMAPRTWNGKTYFQKVYVRSYTSTSMQLVPQLRPDTVVTVTGEADAVPETGKDGKAYANLRIVGNVMLFDGAVPSTGTGSTQAAPTAPAAPAERPPATPTKAANENVDEDVPF